MEAVGDRVGGEVEEGDEDGRYVVLVFANPGRCDDTIRKDGRSWRERGDGRMQDPRGRRSNGWATRRRGIRGCGWVCFLGWQHILLEGISPVWLQLLAQGA